MQGFAARAPDGKLLPIAPHRNRAWITPTATLLRIGCKLGGAVGVLEEGVRAAKECSLHATQKFEPATPRACSSPRFASHPYRLLCCRARPVQRHLGCVSASARASEVPLALVKRCVHGFAPRRRTGLGRASHSAGALGVGSGQLHAALHAPPRRLHG